ncbi:MAG: type I restriction endonuclease subunit R [Ellagibacter isourolithinifaciens]|uniref:type I restriction endonuclease subunit R n=1 Tax=Ellagibacter isourolithinifaciens TaxID=2137581 RepID=UPI002E770222|nr:type I restriction endonuclease subunit R [Ellagibacter isourolithinifaciens]MEE1454329.1 type I restriction endonuclease subunit R [Ellagibacter isourolithinifaciens]
MGSGSYSYEVISSVFNEDAFEQGVVDHLCSEHGYEYLYGPDVPRSSDAFDDAFLPDVIGPALEAINTGISRRAVDAAITKLKEIEGGTLVSKNKSFMDMLQGGVEVRWFDGEGDRNEIVRLVDFDNPERNEFHVVNQWTYIERGTNKRPDVIVFVNGLPLVLFELKSPARAEADNEDAYQQIQNYKRQIPTFFVYNAFCVISDMLHTKVGTITANESRFVEWKSVDGSYEATQYADWKTPLDGMFSKARLVDILKNFILFSEDKKILAGYHQYFAVNKALESVHEAIGGDGKGGVFWHTQGSGKSLSMVFLAHLLEEKLDSPTIVVITDRNDLDSQLFAQFSKCSDFLRQTPVQAQSRADLAQQITSRRANGIIFTTMQKFEEEAAALSDRENVVVMVDEAHRGQYGFEEKFDRDGKKHTGTALLIRRALPNATFIGFTGTPISAEDRSTREVFGDYIDVYDMTQAVEDNATRPVFYESRVVALKLDQGILAKVDDEYEKLTEQANAETIDASKRDFANLDAVLGAPEVIDALCHDIVEHYETNRAHELTGKAMIVAYSRPAAMAIYQRICELRPAWKEEGKLGVVMTMGNQDPEWWFDVVGNKAHVKEMSKRFKDDADPLKIVIVVDMWLTGFDVPSLATMYVYKPMRGYNLMQAIARVNRVYKDKVGGLVVDYVGIVNALKRAMKDYTKRDQKKYGDMDIGKTAYPKFLEKLSVCRDKMFGFDYSEFLTTESAARRSELITGGVNHILAPGDEGTARDFVEQAGVMLKAYGLAKSRATDVQRIEAGYFQVVRELILQLTEQGGGHGGSGKLTLKQVNERINALLEQNIVHTDGVIDLFKVEDETVSIFDPKFLTSLSRMKEKNLAYELLRKLIDDQIKGYRKKSVTQAKKYSELMRGMVNSYLNGQLTNAEVFEEMLKMAKEMLFENQKAKELGLTDEEFAFYEALTQPQAIADYYRERNDELVAITQELAAKMREMRTVDWQKKQSARAAMRVAIKRLLKHHKYPPEGMESALSTVMEQCELWADNAA